MKIKNYLLASVLILSSCTSEFQETFDEPNDVIGSGVRLTVTIPDTALNVTQSKAADVAMNFAGRNLPTSRSLERTVKEILTIPDSEGTPMMYVVNFQNHAGFVIVSATKKFYPIIAHSDNGNYTIGNAETSPSDFFLGEKIPCIKYCAALSDEDAADFIRQWRMYDGEMLTIDRGGSRGSDIPQVYYDSLKRWSMNPNVKVYRYNDYVNTPDYINLEQSTKDAITAQIHYLGNSQYGTVEDVTLVVAEFISESEYVKPLLETHWGQTGGFDLYTPNNYPTGCCAVALGQVMKYHRFPTRYDWDAMHNIYATDCTAMFLADIGAKIDTKYADSGSTSNITKVKKALEEEGYSAQLNSHNSAMVNSDITARYPVIMRGEGAKGAHEWVCDGTEKVLTYTAIKFMTLEYRPTIYGTPTKMVEAYKFNTDIYTLPYRFHMNWGWGGANDGYYWDSNLTIENGSENVSFNSKRLDLVGIRPWR